MLCSVLVIPSHKRIKIQFGKVLKRATGMIRGLLEHLCYHPKDRFLGIFRKRQLKENTTKIYTQRMAL